MGAMTKFPPPSPTFIGARYSGGSQRPKGLVLHGTVSSDNPGTALNIARWWQGPTSPETSAHYLIDPKRVIQCVGDHTVAYHCGYNTGTIALEFCDEQAGPPSRWADADSLAILQRGARLAAELCLAYGISPHRPSVAELKAKGPHGIYGHNDSRLAFGNTTHTDPKDFPWDKFLEMVHVEMRKIRREANPPKPTPDPARTFKVLHAPLHGVSATYAQLRVALRREGATRVAFSEASRQSSWLKRRTRWRATMGDTHKDPRGRMPARDAILMTRRKGHKNIESDSILISKASRPLKIAPERHLSYSVDEVDGELEAVIALHPNAAVKDAWDSDRAEKFRQSMEVLENLVIRLRRKYGADLDIIILGDLNYPDVDDKRYWTPRAVFERLNLSWTSKHIDWVAWSKGLTLVKRTVIEKEENGQDHPWIEVEFRRNKG